MEKQAHLRGFVAGDGIAASLRGVARQGADDIH